MFQSQYQSLVVKQNLFEQKLVCRSVYDPVLTNGHSCGLWLKELGCKCRQQKWGSVARLLSLLSLIGWGTQQSGREVTWGGLDILHRCFLILLELYKVCPLGHNHEADIKPTWEIIWKHLDRAGIFGQVIKVWTDHVMNEWMINCTITGKPSHSSNITQ